ncbi:MAG: enoyl-CoA hydratase-related protein [Dehalococcoidia bacterium]|nr:enoyl-CoA hydratase-related protein [Dehalococcoidia bacterium]
MAEKPVLLYEKKLDGRVVVMTMNRPDAMNAINGELGQALGEAWERFRDDDEAWVAIITGAGDKAFSAGADLKETTLIRTGQLKPVRRRRVSAFPMAEEIGLWKPTIAAINGFAIAGGWAIAQQCDIRLAAAHAELGVSEVRWNMPASWLHTLPRQMLLGHALELVLWGDRRITAQRAYEIGWVNRVVPGEHLMDEAMEWAERILYLAPRDVRNLKEILYRGSYMSPMEGAAFARALEQNLAGMEDSIEGPKAFSEKRKPRFKNK